MYTTRLKKVDTLGLGLLSLLTEFIFVVQTLGRD
jgi:hypothetical protein